MPGQFTFEDFLQSYRMMRRMGPLKSIVGLVPGLGKQLQGADVDDRELSKVEAIVLSMTVERRRGAHQRFAGPGSRAGAARPYSR